MKVLFVHLSDIHIDDGFQVNSIKNTRLIEAIKSNLAHVDQCIVICSGDVAKTAQINEYRVARKFLGKILSELGKSIDEFVNLLMVPGNHDLDLSYDKRKFHNIKEYYDKNNVYNGYKNELHRNKNFMAYAKSKYCYKDSDIISKKILEFGQTKVAVNLINSSPFSTLEYNDKELHYLPSDEMRKLNRDNDVNLTISIMHHSPEWFNSESKLELETLLYSNSDIVFLGHEHVASTENIINKNSCNIYLSRGGEYSGIYSKESKFITLVYDTENKKYIERIYTWDPAGPVFSESSINEKTLIVSKLSICNREEFTRSFYEDSQGLKASCLDYFVFPMLKVKSNEYKNGNEEKIVNKDEFIKSIVKCDIIHITAPEDYGKSTLLKYLYSYYVDAGCVPLYFSETSYHNRVNRIIKNIFDEQYINQNNQFDRYEQQDISKKVILIDNIDKLRSSVERNRLLEYFRENFGTIIFTTTKTENIDVILAIEETFESEYKIKTFELESFYLRKRNDLIKNVCKSVGVLEEDAIHSVIEIMNNLISKNFEMFELSPSTLIHYIKYFAYQDDDTRKKDVVFYEIFENNIINILREKIRDINIKEYLIQLEELAYYMHFNRKPVISLEELSKCFKKYDNIWGSTISKNEMINKLVECKIISNGWKLDHYRFSNNNYFSYFVARKINREINNGSDYEKIYFLAKNICFTINNKILMFLADIRNNTSFVIYLCDQLNEIMKKYSEINFDEPNIYLFNRMDYNNIHIATSDEKARLEENKEHDEEVKTNKEYDEIGFVKEYEYTDADINSFGNTLNRAYKYMEIISKSYASQYSMLKKVDKEKIAQVIFTIPNKLVYAMLKPLDDKFDAITEATYQMVLSLDAGIKKKEIEDMIIDLARAMTLGLYDSIAFDSTTKKTMRNMSEISCNGINNKIQKLMMIAFSSSTNVFLEESIRLLNEYPDNSIVKTFVRLIVRVYIIRNKKLNYKQIAKIAEKIFCVQDRKEIFRLLAIKG